MSWLVALACFVAQPAELEATPVEAPPGEEPVIIVDEAPAESAPDDGPVIIVDEAPAESEGGGDELLVIVDDGAAAPPSAAPAPPPPRVIVRRELDTRLLTDLERQATGEDVLEWWNKGALRLEVSYGPTLGAVAEGWVRWGVAGEDPAPDHDFWLVNVRDGKWLGEVELREAYVRWQAGPVELRCGNQLFIWGKNELLAGADVLNPSDLRFDPSVLVRAPKESRVPVFALSGALGLGDATLELVVVPFFQANRLLVVGRDFALAPPGSSEAAELAAVGAVHPSVEDQLQGAVTGTELPDESPLNASLALRGGLRLGGWDLAATVYHGWDRTPRLRVDEDLLVLLGAADALVADPELLLTDPQLRDAALGVQQKTLVGEQLVRGRHRRLWRFALEAQGVIGDLVVRADAGYTPAQTFYDGVRTPRALPAWLGAVGVEWTRGETWYVALTGYGLVALGAPRDALLLGLERKARDPADRKHAALYGVSLTARWRWEEEGLLVQGTGAYDLEPGDHLLAVELSYDHLEPHVARLGLVVLEGPAGSLGRRFTRNDFVYLGYSLAW